MKLIILEGGDRLGKSTLIEGICRHHNYDNVMIRHFGKPPKHIQPEDVLKFQFDCFDNEIFLIDQFNGVFAWKHKYYEDMFIWNRSHLGEYVYSQMFRNGDPKTLKFKLTTWEEFMFPDQYDVFLITLTADPEFFLNNEDGQSFSQTLEQKTKELQLFKEAHNFSLIKNKLLLKVDKDGKFKPKEEILNTVLNFIKNE